MIKHAHTKFWFDLLRNKKLHDYHNSLLVFEKHSRWGDFIHPSLAVDILYIENLPRGNSVPNMSHKMIVNSENHLRQNHEVKFKFTILFLCSAYWLSPIPKEIPFLFSYWSHFSQATIYLGKVEIRKKLGFQVTGTRFKFLLYVEEKLIKIQLTR